MGRRIIATGVAGLPTKRKIITVAGMRRGEKCTRLPQQGGRLTDGTRTARAALFTCMGGANAFSQTRCCSIPAWHVTPRPIYSLRPSAAALARSL
jgi:hypothetical protein